MCNGTDGGGADSILKVTDDAVSVFASGLSKPQGMAEDNEGNLYVANYGGNNIIMFRAVNGVLSKTPIVFAGGLHAPMDLAFDRAGNLFEADQDSGTINRFIFNGTELSRIPTHLITGLTDNNVPTGVCFDRQGNLYVAVLIGGILKFANNGGLETTPTIFSNISRAREMTLDKNGNLFTADHVQQRIYEFVNSPSGLSNEPHIFAERRGLYAPIGVAFDSTGNLYVANWGYGSGTDSLVYPVNKGVLSTEPVPFVGGLTSPSYILDYSLRVSLE